MPQTQTQTSWPLVDRRCRSKRNRARRFVNNYWLVPVVVIYLQLLAAVINVPQGKGLVEQNRVFLSGIPLAAHIVAHDFPYAALGHAKELLHAAGTNRAQPSIDQVAFHVERDKEAIYAWLLDSRAIRHTEVGGVVALDDGGSVRLYSIPSANGRFLESLPQGQPDALYASLRSPGAREMVGVLRGETAMLDRILALWRNPSIPLEARDAALDSFRVALETVSEARYVSAPLEFKAALGRMPAWRFAGLFHFHNEVGSPPSDTDLEASLREREFVFCLAPDGFDLYDLENGRAQVRHFHVA
ncbi:MAG: hypothetical protein OEW11_07100 [Nitrospirota bacterium]|nr:hypothetical protein [Nitrospirota bacterium]